MPYIVTTKQTDKASTALGTAHSDATFTLTRLAVATLNEAREAVASNPTLAANRLHPETDARERITEQGGAMTLRDGTVIEVEPCNPVHLAERAGTWAVGRSDAQIIDAYNAAQGDQTR